MKTLKHLISLPLFLSIGLMGKISAEVGNQLCYPGDNITDSKLFSLKSKNIRKPTLYFWEHYWPYVRSVYSELFFGSLEMPETYGFIHGNRQQIQNNAKQHCHPFTEELSNLLMDEYQFSFMKIVSDIQIIDDNPWWCKDYGTMNHPMAFGGKPTHYCYPKGQLISEAILLGDKEKYTHIYILIREYIME